MEPSKVYLLPLAVFVLFPATFIITYCIAVLLGHTEPEFPYISDTGTQSPESCIFGQALNLGAFLILFTLYIRFRQIAEFYRNHSSSSSIVRLNKAAFIVGSLSALGISLVANFQETSVLSIHICGALLAFGGGVAYLWLQALCSYKTHPLVNNIGVAHLRMFLAVVATICFVLGSITAIIAKTQYNGNNPRKWFPGDGGWQCHVISTASEWICATAFNIFMLTLVDEFKSLSVESPQVYITIENLTASQYLYSHEANSGSTNDIQAILSSHNYGS
ncbi:DNA damage-regulated autophagy modulator protein 2 [Armadillidium nasatum]|uniref:DNA damage-regulated autophagy modulator protein 2 n=1 Tax=Armadillidium nasatum TaxID=96803 RepID=A0A5N5SNY4_9CRUS|nr:DNA damage-regulated autophagy modulator protein 2 [Armadillidium nasatum]